MLTSCTSSPIEAKTEEHMEYAALLTLAWVLTGTTENNTDHKCSFLFLLLLLTSITVTSVYFLTDTSLSYFVILCDSLSI